MNLLKRVVDIQEWRSQHQDVGFIPTMGALHEGHFSLVRKALSENSTTLVSIFVNPTQFNNPDDLQTYPRTLEKDLESLEQLGVDAVFTPTQEELYPDGYRYKITESNESKVLEGAHRPGHFEGVLTVVLKLLNLTGCQRCYMGEKDYQQLKLVTDMVHGLFIPTKIIGVPTVREADGLAMSSRNSLLNSNAREKAPLIYKLLNSETPLNHVVTQLEEAGFNVDYAEKKWGRKLVAAEIGGVRLIDNV